MKLANLLSSFLFMIGLYSCATTSIQLPTEVEYEFVRFTNVIKKHCKPGVFTPINNYKVEMVDKLDTPWMVGVCYNYPGTTYRHIKIRKDYWAAADDVDRMALIAHEMIHCFLNLNGHVEREGHIMNSTLSYFPNYDVLWEHLNEYTKERCSQ